MKKKISVVIPSNNNKYILKTISSVKEIADEIIIVNSSGEKETFKHLDYLTVVEAPTNKTNASKARNIGFEKARNKIILFIDADVEIKNESIDRVRELAEGLRENEIMSGIYQTSSKLGKISNIFTLILQYRLQTINRSEKFKLLYSSHFLIYRNLFLEIGGFNENLDTWEDIDFFIRAQKLSNAEISLSSDFKTLHHKNYGFFSFLKETTKKTFNATFAKLDSMSLFKRTTFLIDWKINLIPLPIPIFLLCLYLSKNIFLTFFIFITVFSFNLYITRKIFDIKNLLLGNTIISIVGLCAWVSSLIALLSFYFILAKRNLVNFKNILICLIRAIFKYGKPIQIIQYVTSRCNLRCDHCFYKETLDKKDPGELPANILIESAKQSGPILWYSLAGGEPFLRKDFSDIVNGVKKEATPQIISLPTNGWYTQRTFLSTLKVLQKLKTGLFVIFFSVDGYGESHDKIRGENSFKKLCETYDKLKKLSKIYPRLHLNLVITVQNFNKDLFPGIIKKLYDKFRPTSISINLFRHHDINAPKIDPQIISAYERAIKEYDKIRIKNNYGIIGSHFLKAKERVQKDLILAVSKEEKFVTKCTAGNLSYVGMEDGTLKPCEILSNKIGNFATQNNMDALYKSKEAKELRKFIVDTKCKCTYECSMSTNTLFNGNMFVKLLKQTTKDILHL